MGGEWRRCNLGDFVSLQRGHDLTESQRRPGKVPVMGSAGQNGFHDKSLAPGPGVVIGRSGASFGKVHYCAVDYWPHNTALYVTDFKGNDPRFAYYLLSTIDFSRYNSGSAQPSLNRNYIYSIPISAPEQIEQQAIACILGALDDKIELNRRMNLTLEAMAQTIFKSWFVDFNPVRAKAAGQQPLGLASHIADLFPDSFKNSAMGSIPKGWRSELIANVATIIKGLSYRSDELNPSRTALVTLKSIARGGGYRSDGLKSFTGCYKPEQVVKPGELVIAYTDVTQAAEVIGKPAIVSNIKDYDTLVASLDLSIIRPKLDYLGIPFLYILFKTDDFQAHAYAHTNGTTVLHLDRNAVPTYEFLLPSDSILKVFNHIIAPLFNKIEVNAVEESTIVSLRETLLPRLISGEIRVKDAERFLEKHV